MALLSENEWREFLLRHPQAHLLQTAEWGRLKERFGWKAVRLVHDDCGAQVLLRALPLGFHIAYVPKGPVGEQPESIWPHIDRVCREHRTVFLKIEPDLWQQPGDGGEAPEGFQSSTETIQPPRTILLDLARDEAEILASMKAKTRYNIGLAERKGVLVQPSQDFALFSSLLAETGERDGFEVHSRDYYQQAYTLFHPLGQCELLTASYEGQTLAALMVFARGATAWYFYGASSDQHRELMPAYLLQWEAIRWARRTGCRVYDFWGIPDEDEQTLEAGFTGRSDGLWGVYRFKRGFGGRVCRAAGPWDRVYLPWVYRLYKMRAKRR